MKNIHFIAGLPRSGSGLLETLLCQNPDIYAAPASVLFKVYGRLSDVHDEPENVEYNRNFHLNDIYLNLPQIFYTRYTQNNIFDKNCNWISPFGLQIIEKFITPEPRIICPVRNIADILASWSHIINASSLNKDNSLDAEVAKHTFPDKPMADRRADWLMLPNNDIYNIINWMVAAKESDFGKFIHFVDYDDLCNNPQDELNKIYDFIGVPRFTNSFTNIHDFRDLSAQSIYGIKNLHKIDSTIVKDVVAKDVLLPETIERYSGMEFWK